MVVEFFQMLTVDISTADISKTQQLTPKRSRWIHSTTSKNLVF